MLEKGKESGAELAMTNAGGLRSSFSAGNITMADVMMVLPFVNVLSYMNVTGSQILDTLERVFAGRDKVSGRPVISKPQWSGLEVNFDPRRPAYSRVVSVHIQGNPLRLSKTYRLVTSDFLANGGDAILLPGGYTEGEDIAQVVASYLRTKDKIEPLTFKRIINLAGSVSQSHRKHSSWGAGTGSQIVIRR
jgi:5'-nucleotidase